MRFVASKESKKKYDTRLGKLDLATRELIDTEHKYRTDLDVVQDRVIKQLLWHAEQDALKLSKQALSSLLPFLRQWALLVELHSELDGSFQARPFQNSCTSNY